MQNIEKFISPFIENQFPSFYKEEGPQLIAFAKAYYEWMEEETQVIRLDTVDGFSVGDTVRQEHTETNAVEGTILSIDTDAKTLHILHTTSEAKGEDFSAPGTITNLTTPATALILEEVFNGGVLHHARHLTEYRDIDTTLEKFIINFKEKYLKNIQFDIATNKQLLIKNSLDLYRSKGTERSIDLFFKLLYGSGAEVSYPGEKIFRASDGIWERPEYLEIMHSKNNVDYVGKQVIGALSGAKAFVERYIRRRTSAGYVDILYITDRSGEFRNGELIGINQNNTPIFDITKRSKLLGSVKRVTVLTKGRNFKVGDLVSFSGSSSGGIGGIARVSEIKDSTGLVDFLFYDGGWGYTLEADSIVSEKVLSLDNVDVSDTSFNYFSLFEKVVQPLVDITLTSNTGTLKVGDTLNRWESGSVVASGKIVDIEGTTVTINHTYGPITTGTYYTTGNLVSLVTNAILDRSVSGDMMGAPTVYTLNLKDYIGTLNINDDVIQQNTTYIHAHGHIDSIVGSTIILSSANGVFKVGERLEIGNNSSVSANVESVSFAPGVYNIARYVNQITYNSANNNTVLTSNSIYRYAPNGSIIAEGKLVTASYTAGSGTLTYVPIRGYFDETDYIYTTGNTAVAIVVTMQELVSGGDYIPTEYSTIIAPINGTTGTLSRTSYGSGAGFTVGTIGETEDIFIGTDLINANNNGFIDYDRKILTVDDETGFTIGDRVYQQVSKIAFDPSTAIAANGFITIPSANTRFTVGDIIRYEADFGNTVINCLESPTYYYVYQSNSSGLFLSYPSNKTIVINTSNYSTFANNVVSETGHYFYKMAHGTVFELGTGAVKTKDNHNYFGNTGGTVGTSSFANTSLYKYGDDLINAVINDTSDYTTLSKASRQYPGLPIASAAFGFPKNPQGDAKDLIFHNLNFEKFTLGYIGALANINPGSDYNVDPYVLVRQPYISSFNRKDFIIDIKDATGIFLEGERVTQTLANLVFHDIEVSNGAYGNTFNSKSLVFSTKYEVSNTADFIYYTSNTSTFNSSDVDATLNFIPIPDADIIYSINDTVRYRTDTGNTVIAGLSNNSFYTVLTSNSSGVIIDGNITFTPNTETFDSAADVGALATNFISIASASTLFPSGTEVRYYTDASSIPVSDLANNTIYFVKNANSSGLYLSTDGSDTVSLAPQITGTTGHYIKAYNSNADGNYLIKYANEFANGLPVIYRLIGGSAIGGLTADALYTIDSANTIGFKLKDSAGLSVDLTSTTSEYSHMISTVPGFLPGDKIYQNTTNAFVHSVFSNTSGDWLRISANTADFVTTSATNEIIYSYTNPYVSANVLTIDSDIQVVATAKGIIKSANSTQVAVKRITFENTFQVGSKLIGESTAVEANVISVTEDFNVLPIGLNANVQANVITANGQITALQVVDSGVNYSNGEIVTFTSTDGNRSGTTKLIIDGSGIGEGYWKSSKGFLSDAMSIHDGDYYQEYSYEIFSKMSVDKYADMFKKVMHTAGTKFFGSVSVYEEVNTMADVIAISTSQELSFNSYDDVSNSNETIDTNMATGMPFANGDVVTYYTSSSNTVVTGLANNTNYYVVQTNGQYLKLATTSGGDPINITATGTTGASSGHYLLKVVEE